MNPKSLSIARNDDVKINRHVSVASQVYELIRPEIVNASLRPGEQLSEQGLAQRYGVSRTPIREALLRLTEEDLVRIVPQVGTYVTKISLVTVGEAQFIRQALECAAVRVAAERADPKIWAILDRIIEDQRRASDAGDHTAFYSADEALHAAIASASGHPRVWKVAAAEKLQLDRVRMIDVAQRIDLESLVAQHTVIVAALKAKDPDAAEIAMKRHLGDVFIRLESLVEVNKDYFEDLDAILLPSGAAR